MLRRYAATLAAIDAASRMMLIMPLALMLPRHATLPMLYAYFAPLTEMLITTLPCYGDFRHDSDGCRHDLFSA